MWKKYAMHVLKWLLVYFIFSFALRILVDVTTTFDQDGWRGFLLAVMYTVVGWKAANDIVGRSSKVFEELRKK